MVQNVYIVFPGHLDKPSRSKKGVPQLGKGVTTDDEDEKELIPYEFQVDIFKIDNLYIWLVVVKKNLHSFDNSFIWKVPQ